VWTPVNSEYRFTLLPPNYILSNSLFMGTGGHLEYLCGILNSSLFRFYLDLILTRGNYAYGSADTFKDIPIFMPSGALEKEIKQLTISLLAIDANHAREKIKELNEMIFDLYDLTPEEREAIGFVEIR